MGRIGFPEHGRWLLQQQRRHTSRPSPGRLPAKPRIVPQVAPALCRLSGLEPLGSTRRSTFQRRGARQCHTRLGKVQARSWRATTGHLLDVCRERVENGAQIVDVNMDEGMLDGSPRCVASSTCARRAGYRQGSGDDRLVEVGSSEAACQCVQSESIIIDLMKGRRQFRQHAGLYRRCGAAVIVMAFDGASQADTRARKVEICTRAYRILVDGSGSRRKISFSTQHLCGRHWHAEPNQQLRRRLRRGDAQ